MPRIEHIQMKNIIKRFPGVMAVRGVDFDVKAGEIHALLGENGAGKSTLMKMLYGLYQPDGGQILINGQPTVINSPAEAMQQGIGMIHQHFMLVPSLTVTENVALANASQGNVRLDLPSVSSRLRDLSKQYHLKVDPNAPIWQLSVGEQQRVEILRALYQGAELLILDEPTAVLTPQESEDLFRVLQQMAKDGRSLIFITHKLNEVLSVSQRITVLRDGQHINTIPTQGATKRQLAEMMVGRAVLLEYDRVPMQKGDCMLRLEKVSAKNDRGEDGLRNLSLDVHGGEIVGLAGVSGNGQRELAEVIAGLRTPTQGRIILDGQNIAGKSPDQLHALGRLSYIPEERMVDGAIKNFTVAENFILQDHARKPYSFGGFFNFRAIEQACRDVIRRFEIKTPGTQTPIKSLSGGNIQKLILARELARAPKVLLASQPTRGVDIGASEYIHQQLLEQRARGTAILLISEDLDEILALADRVAVIYEGRIVADLPREQVTVQQIGAFMAGTQIEHT